MEGVKEFILGTPVFPYLWVPHCIMMSIVLRNSLGSDKWYKFSREHPLSCFLLGLLYIYPGGLLSSLVLGDSLLSFLTLTSNLYAACASWYLVFYCPQDAVYRGLAATHIVPFLAVPQDWQRVGLVLSGLQTINGRSPGLFLYPVVFGVIKSSGFMITKYIEVGILHGLKTGFRVPNQATKTMVVSAVLLQLQILYSLLPCSVEDLYCALVLFAVVMRLLTIIFTQADWDPYLSLESSVCRLLYGEVEEILEKEKTEEQEETKTKKDD